MQSFSFPTVGSIPSDWQRNGRRYTIKTEAIGTAFSMSDHWLYESSVILPCALTGEKYVLLINRNKTSGQGQQDGEVITARTSDDPDGFGSETVILDNSDGSVDNICDMINARPIWDGSQWHIYVQAKPGDWTNPNSCKDEDTIANIYEAVGSSLNPPSAFEWVKEPGTSHARAIISGSALPIGIGEGFQAFNPNLYGIPGWPFMLIYQDWGCGNSDGDNCGHAPFNYISQDDSSYGYWYGPAELVYLGATGFGSVLVFPDAILLGSLDAGRHGYPGIGFSPTCYSTDSRFLYCTGIGFFDNPSNVPYAAPVTTPYTQSNAPNHGWPFAGALESTSSDTNGPKMNSPRLARNEYGYIPPVSYHGFPRSWVTYLYYNPAQANDNATDPCRYNHWPSSSQSIAVSRLTITEESSARTQS